VGIGGAKDTCVRLGKEAACLRVVGSVNPDPDAARLEQELTALGNYIGIGAMGFAGSSLVVATHVELAHTHTGGMPVGIHLFCLSSRRATARVHADGRVEFRADPAWFTDYYRRLGIE
jgi:L(+)-tartrate dehydratase alpha subunit